MEQRGIRAGHRAGLPTALRMVGGSLGSEQQTCSVKVQMGNLLGSVACLAPILLPLQSKSSHRREFERLCCASVKFSVCISHHVHISE